MTVYTSPTSSPIGENGEVPHDLYLLAAMEGTIDAVRFRFDGVSNDLAQELPNGAGRSMSAVIASMRLREEQLVDTLSGKKLSPRATAAFLRDTNAWADLGKFLHLRQESLAYLRRLPPAGWQRKVEHEELGTVTISNLVRTTVERDAQALNELADLRQALVGGTVPGTRGRLP